MLCKHRDAQKQQRPKLCYHAKLASGKLLLEGKLRSLSQAASAKLKLKDKVKLGKEAEATVSRQ